LELIYSLGYNGFGILDLVSFVKYHIEKAVLFKEAHAPFELLIVHY
jgi:hypothetical protein